MVVILIGMVGFASQMVGLGFADGQGQLLAGDGQVKRLA